MPTNRCEAFEARQRSLPVGFAVSSATTRPIVPAAMAVRKCGEWDVK